MSDRLSIPLAEAILAKDSWEEQHAIQLAAMQPDVAEGFRRLQTEYDRLKWLEGLIHAQRQRINQAHVALFPARPA